jgi:hypothetical protein
MEGAVLKARSTVMLAHRGDRPLDTAPSALVSTWSGGEAGRPRTEEHGSRWGGAAAKPRHRLGRGEGSRSASRVTSLADRTRRRISHDTVGWLVREAASRACHLGFSAFLRPSTPVSLD